MRLIRLLEPLWWALFGAGGFAAAMVLPALLLVVGLAFPAADAKQRACFAIISPPFCAA